MNSLLKLVVYFSFTLVTLTSFSQPIESKKSIPKSIYFSNTHNSNFHFSSFNLNEKLNFSTYNFLQIETLYFRKEQLNINLEAFKIRPSLLIFDSYKKLKETEYLEKSFFKVSSLYNLPRKNKNL